MRVSTFFATMISMAFFTLSDDVILKILFHFEFSAILVDGKLNLFIIRLGHSSSTKDGGQNV
jgi:hypothetical protein